MLQGLGVASKGSASFGASMWGVIGRARGEAGPRGELGRAGLSFGFGLGWGFPGFWASFPFSSSISFPF